MIAKIRAFYKAFLFCIFTTSINTVDARDIKLLVLIIASDNVPVYVELQKIWRSYMHLDPEHVEVYFMKGNPSQTQEAVIDRDTIWIKSPESLIPGLINKTVLSLKFLLPRMHEFDYVLRTNLSSFYVFPRLLNFLKHLPTEGVYCGSSIGAHGPHIASGSGFIMSRDVAALLVKHQTRLVNNCSTYDDVLIGTFMQQLRISLIHHTRMDCYCLNDWEVLKNNIPYDAFHFRVKNPEDIRCVHDIYMQRHLLHMFYQ